MDTDHDFHSLSKGVFVIPFQPDAADDAPGPSRLEKTYAAANKAYEDAYWDYERERTDEQLDEIAAWLEECAAPPVFRPAFAIHRLPVALVQNLSPSVPPLLSSLGARVAALNGRDMGDLAAATRAVAVGFLGEAALAAKKAGRTPIDEVERWWSGLIKQAPLLVHIQNAQLIPAAVLAELIYILNLHHAVPFRLLISVPSIAVFTSNWQLLEPGDVALSILSAGRSRRRGAGVNAILKAASNARETPISISDTVREELQREEDMFGGGAAATLKSLKWLLLHHAHTSPLASLAEEDLSPEQVTRLQCVVEGIKAGDESHRDLFTVDSVPDLFSTQNPAPRLSILQAMAKPGTFLPPDDIAEEGGAEEEMEDEDPTPRKTARTVNAPANSPTSRKRKAPDSPTANGTASSRERRDARDAPADLGQRFKEIETLHALWRSAGKAVNLWDWLEGFRAAVSDEPEEGEKETETGEHGESGVPNGQANGTAGGAANGGANGTRASAEDKDAEEQAQHATFIRFIEECRMLGLVRARGSRTTRRTDEVVKGVLMI